MEYLWPILRENKMVALTSSPHVPLISLNLLCWFIWITQPSQRAFHYECCCPAVRCQALLQAPFLSVCLSFFAQSIQWCAAYARGQPPFMSKRRTNRWSQEWSDQFINLLNKVVYWYSPSYQGSLGYYLFHKVETLLSPSPPCQGYSLTSAPAVVALRQWNLWKRQAFSHRDVHGLSSHAEGQSALLLDFIEIGAWHWFAFGSSVFSWCIIGIRAALV